MPAPEQLPGLADLDRLDLVFAALAHRTRRAILVALLANRGSQTSGKIAERVDHSWQTTSRHLRQHSGINPPCGNSPRGNGVGAGGGNSREWDGKPALFSLR